MNDYSEIPILEEKGRKLTVEQVPQVREPLTGILIDTRKTLQEALMIAHAIKVHLTAGETREVGWPEPECMMHECMALRELATSLREELQNMREVLGA